MFTISGTSIPVVGASLEVEATEIGQVGDGGVEVGPREKKQVAWLDQNPDFSVVLDGFLGRRQVGKAPSLFASSFQFLEIPITTIVLTGPGKPAGVDGQGSLGRERVDRSPPVHLAPQVGAPGISVSLQGLHPAVLLRRAGGVDAKPEKVPVEVVLEEAQVFEQLSEPFPDPGLGVDRFDQTGGFLQKIGVVVSLKRLSPELVLDSLVYDIDQV